MSNLAEQPLTRTRHRLGHAWALARHHLRLDVHRLVPVPRHLAREELVQQHCEGEDVHGGRVGLQLRVRLRVRVRGGFGFGLGEGSGSGSGSG